MRFYNPATATIQDYGLLHVMYVELYEMMYKLCPTIGDYDDYGYLYQTMWVDGCSTQFILCLGGL